MKKWTVWSALALLVATTACEKKSNPVAASDSNVGSTAAVLDAKTGVTITAPKAVSPADGAQIKNVNQPVTVVFTPGITTGKSQLAYTIEVASDSGFGSIASTKTGITGTSQISTKLDRLTPDKTYYWRVRGVYSGSDGPNSKSRSFTIGPEVKLSTPVLAAPGATATVGGNATLTVNNVQKTGPAGQVFYRFDVADSSSFANLLFTTTVPEQGGASTSAVITADLPNGTYWWRVQATDPSNEVTTDFSVANPFTVQLFDMKKAIIYDNPPDVAFWDVNATITRVDTAGPYIVVDFDRRTAGPAWNEVGFGDGSLQYTLGACFNIDNQWYCSAPVQFWAGRELEAGGPVSQMAENWYYNPIRWGRMSGHQPAPGELVGFWVGHGNLRGGNGNIYKERSNVQLVPFNTLWTGASLQRLPLSVPTLANALKLPKH